MTPRSLPLAAAATLLATGLAVAPALTSPAGAAPAHGDQRVCAAPKAGFAACDAHVRTIITPDGKARPDATSSWTSGYAHDDLVSAYNLPATTSTTATVAIVDAYANPNAASDLAVYRSTTGLPPLGALQLQQRSQTGGSITTVKGDTGWGQEEMLDLEMVSAICPSCNILYVGANSSQFSDLAAAVNYAATQGGVTVISNSYGGSEFSTETSLAKSYDHTGIAITVSSGDSGYGAQAPAVFNTVVAVGGTHLVRDTSKPRGWSETTWSGAGSGCSAYIQAVQSWQQKVSPYCSRRAEADVSAVADPNTGVAVYDTYGSTGGSWYVFGGTSVAAPLVGAVYAVSGHTAGYPAGIAYGTPSGLNDVTSGSNTRRCRAGNLCTAGPGWDGPTGVGTPNGLAAF